MTDTAINEDKLFQMTPKGMLIGTLVKFGCPLFLGDIVWDEFVDFCEKRSEGQTGDVTAILLDGKGGTVVKVSAFEEEITAPCESHAGGPDTPPATHQSRSAGPSPF